jgi:hypothetical protein
MMNSVSDPIFLRNETENPQPNVDVRRASAAA